MGDTSLVFTLPPDAIKKLAGLKDKKVTFSVFYPLEEAFKRLQELHDIALLDAGGVYSPAVVSPLLKWKYARSAFLESTLSALAHFATMPELQRSAWFRLLLDYIEKTGRYDGLEGLLVSGVGAAKAARREELIARTKSLVSGMPSDNVSAGMPFVVAVDVASGRVAILPNSAFRGYDPYGIRDVLDTRIRYNSTLERIAQQSEGGTTPLTENDRDAICDLVGLAPIIHENGGGFAWSVGWTHRAGRRRRCGRRSRSRWGC
jgi:hypothetical protein